MIGACAIAIAGITDYTKSHRAPLVIAEVIDVPPSVPQFPVHAIFSVGVTTYGRDEGVVSFVDGWLVFQGRRTSFSLSPQEVRELNPVPKPYFRKNQRKKRTKYLLQWTTSDATGSIQMFAMNSLEGLGGGLLNAFRDAFDQWINGPRPAENNAMLPPVKPQPLARKQALARRWMADTAVVTGLILFGGIVFPQNFPGGLQKLQYSLGGFLLAKGLVVAWYTRKDLRILDTMVRKADPELHDPR